MSFYDNSTSMTIIIDTKTIMHIRRNSNLFILDFVILGKILKISKYKGFNSQTLVLKKQIHPTHVMNNNRRIRI